MSTDKSPETTWVYALKEAASDEIRYVGASVDPVVRMRAHMGNGNNSSKAMKAWCKDVRKRRGEVELVLLEEVPTRSHQTGARVPEVAEAEDRWMVRLLDEGHRLLNVRRPLTHAEYADRDKRLFEEAVERGKRMFGS